MPYEIVVEHLSDRELLILAVKGVNANNERLDKIDKLLDKQNDRIRSLENWRYLLSGGLLAVGSLASWIMSKIKLL